MIYITCPIYCHKVFYIIMEALAKELQSLHYQVQIDMLPDNVCRLENEMMILFGPQHVQNLSDTLHKNTAIVYNLEQLISKNWDELLHHLQHVFCMWDYSSLNVTYTKEHFPALHDKHMLVPFGYSTAYENPIIRDSTEPLITDRIAFIGNLSGRRLDIIQKLSSMVPVDVYDRHYYNTYEDVVKRYQTFVNIHFHEDPNILEVVRILPLLLHGRSVLSEKSNDDELDSTFSSVVSFIDCTTMEGCRDILRPPPPSAESLMALPKWSHAIVKGLETTRFDQFKKSTKVAVATLHCNNRSAIFEVVDTFAKETSSRDFTWVIFSQGCEPSHNDEIVARLESHGFRHQMIRHDQNLGWSKGMNALYEILVRDGYDYVLHLEDDWLCHVNTNNMQWLDDSCVYLHENPHVSTLFLRKYVSDEDKHMYGWTRNIFYQCFQHANPFNYQDKIQNQPKVSFRSLVLRRIPEFLYSANPTLFRLRDYMDKHVFPFPQFDDTSHKQGEWKTTTMNDASQWGFSEALAMEKIRDLVCMNVNKGFFYHRN